jgi:hypothetical protein
MVVNTILIFKQVNSPQLSQIEDARITATSALEVQSTCDNTGCGQTKIYLLNSKKSNSRDTDM